MPDASAWTAFFSAQVGATAALSGLVIVAISINLARILSFPYLPGRAAETLIILVGALIVSSVMLMPGSLVALGEIGVVIAAMVWSACVFIHVNAFRARASAPAGSFVSRLILSQMTALAMVAGCVLLASGDGSGLYWLAAGALLAIVNAVFATWVLLIEILR